jgi:metal-responsive CopG/Arc/MetJ family transcriptional regulator
MSDKQVIGVYLKKETLFRLEKLSEKKETNRNKLINELLEFSIDVYEQELEIKKEVFKEYSDLEQKAIIAEFEKLAFSS